MKQKVLLAAGGTGGHVITAQVVAKELIDSGIAVFFAGNGLENNTYFHRSQFAYADMRAAPLAFSPIAALRFLGKTVLGVKDACAILQREKPNLVVGFGSFHTVPMIAAAILCRIPYILYEANAIPGRVIRLFASKAAFTACFFEEARSQIRGKTVVSQHPMRDCFRQTVEKEVARAFFGLPLEGTCVLFIGGSQGAESLNILGPQMVECFSEKIHVIHLAGKKANLEDLRQRYARSGFQVVVKGFEEKMQYALAACDVVISRAGASAIAEIEALRKPAIYIPYKYAMDGHQLLNARAAMTRCSAIVIEEQSATPRGLFEAVKQSIVGTSSVMPVQSNHTLCSLITTILREG